MKSKTLFMCIGIASLCMTVGSLSHGATNDHYSTADGNHQYGMADLGGTVDVYAFTASAYATLEAEINILPVYPYAGEVKVYALRSSAKRTSLFRLARDGIS